jgi:diphosphomevalonate decarboxylase
MKATANAGSNIAFVKYWGVGKGRRERRLPLNPSVSMTLDVARTTTTVEFLPRLKADSCRINDKPAPPEAAERVRRVMDRVRQLAGSKRFARVASVNHFPTSAGVASSASGFAALALAAVRAAGLATSPKTLVPLTILGSGSACRSLHGGYVLWSPPQKGRQASSVRQLEAEESWPLVDLVAILSRKQKPVPSEQGHLLAWTSPLLKGRLVSLGKIVRKVKRAIRERDLPALGESLEADALCMHAVMMTSRPALLYWVPATVAVIKAVRHWRIRKGLDCYFTIDAGPNVHVITAPEQARAVSKALKRVKGVQEVLCCPTGRGAYLVEDEHLF